jgi:rubrerythrin
MIAQRTGTIRHRAKSNAVQEAMNVLAHSRVTIRRWVCEVCGMVHTGAAPHECESCGVSALVQQPDLHREMSSHW